MDARCWRGAGRAAATSSPSATKRPSGTPTSANSGAGGALTFPRQSRVLRTAEFRTIYDHGTRLSGPLFTAFCLSRKDGERETARLGLTVPRAIGGAVVRNRIKRRLREAFRLHRAEIGPQWDVVINPRRAARDAAFTEIERALRRVIEKCGR